MLTVLYIILAVIVILGFLAIIKKPGSVYKNEPDQWNPMQGKYVRFVEDVNEPENADGVRGHLEAISPSSHKPGFYEAVVKRMLDIILSFCGLVILSPVFLFLTIWILIDDPGPVLFTQKRIGRDKQYFKLHNVVSTAA